MKLFVNPKSTSYAISVFVGVFVFVFQSLAQSEINNGLKFNGNNFVDCGNPSGNLFDFTGEGTIEAWVKVTVTPPPTNSTTFYSILAKDEGPGENNKWIFGIQDGKLIFHVNSPAENSGVVFSQFYTLYSQSFNLQLNKYYNFVITKDKDNIVTFYVNGVNAGSTVLMRKVPFVKAPLLIGKAESGFFMNGEIYEIRFWKKALDNDQLKQWMLRRLDTLHPEYASLAACFRFVGTKETIIANRSDIVAKLENNSSPFWKTPVLPAWSIILIFATLMVTILCFILYRMQQKMKQEKLEMELFTAQISHENNNGIGMMINILSSQLNKKGLSHLETQLKQRLQTIADLQSIEYIMPGEQSVAFKKYITHLVDKMNAVFNDGRQIIYNMDLPEKVKVKHATKLAVLIRELMLNSLKHAFKGKTNGEISISITPVDNGFFRFEFSDNGVGIIDEKNLRPSIGTALINSVSCQLGGKPDIVTVNGYKFMLLFK